MAKNEANLPAQFLKDATTLSVNVGINEVVSVFVSKYETQLFTKKDNLAAEIRSAKRALEDLDKKLIDGVDKSKYDVNVPQLGFTFRVGEVSVSWENSWHGKKNMVCIHLIMSDKQEARDDRDVYTKYINEPIAASYVKQRETLEKQLAQYEAELLETITEIKTIGRKERQIRGRISEMKLEEAGHMELLNNPQLLKLIESK